METLTHETRKKGRLSAQKIVNLKNRDFFSNMVLLFMSYVLSSCVEFIV